MKRRTPADGADLLRGGLDGGVGGGVLGRGAAVHLAGGGVADLVVARERLPPLERGVRAGGDGLGAQRLLVPQRRDLAGHDAAQVVLEPDDVDGVAADGAQAAAVGDALAGGDEEADRLVGGRELRGAAQGAQRAPRGAVPLDLAAAAGPGEDPPPGGPRARLGDLELRPADLLDDQARGARPPRRRGWCRRRRGPRPGRRPSPGRGRGSRSRGSGCGSGRPARGTGRRAGRGRGRGRSRCRSARAPRRADLPELPVLLDLSGRLGRVDEAEAAGGRVATGVTTGVKRRVSSRGRGVLTRQTLRRGRAPWSALEWPAGTDRPGCRHRSCAAGGRCASSRSSR